MMEKKRAFSKKLIIFGAGNYGSRACCKLKGSREIAYFVDNNEEMQGKSLHKIPIISVDKMKDIYNSALYELVVCVKEYQPITGQLADIGITDYYIMLQGLLFRCDETEKLVPVELSRYEYYQKENDEKNILFVQDVACIRTHKIAALMKKSGYKIFLLYTAEPPEMNNAEYAEMYDAVYTFYTGKALIDFVKNSDFDIVHSSNEPDMLTNLLLITGKPVVFDTHDMMSLRNPESMENLALEYIANTASDGNIYTSALVTEIAKKKFGLEGKELLSWENTVLEQEEITAVQEKLSSIDGELHCVYEGGINGSNRLNHRFFEEIWEKITACGIHIHFYSPSEEKYCRELEKKSEYLHYEGKRGTKALIQEMTRYDCGLLLLNVNEQNKTFLQTASPNKLYEYINAGLPVAVGNIKSLIDFVEKYGVGKRLDPEKDIKEQIAVISRIPIEKDFLTKNRLTMMSKSRELVDFYERVKKGKVSR